MCTCDPEHPISYLLCIEHGAANLQLSANPETVDLVGIHPQVSEYDPGEAWAEGELWPTDEDISPPTAPASRTERNSSSTLSVAITAPPVR